jgi:hypothetical protein
MTTEQTIKKPHAEPTNAGFANNADRAATIWSKFKLAALISDAGM